MYLMNIIINYSLFKLQLMCSLKSFIHSLSFVTIAFCLALFFFPSCRKDGYSLKCLTCTAKYNASTVAGSREACGEEEQRKFRDEFRHVEDAGGKIECK